MAIKADGIPRRVEAIAAGLPDREQRMAAVAMAISIGLVDGGLAEAEMTLVKMLGDALSLSDADISSLISAAKVGCVRQLIDDSAPTNQLYVETMMLMASADGKLDPAELDKFGEQLASQPEFADLTPKQAGIYMERCLDKLAAEGVEARLDALVAGLREEEQRFVAFRLALEMCLADGSASFHERELLKLFQERLGLSEEFVSSQVERLVGGSH